MIKKAMSFIIYVLRNEKKKIFIFFSMVSMFIVLQFPYADLSDFITAQISKGTNNQVYVQFKDPGISFFPSLGFELNDVNVETSFLPPIKAGSIAIAPSILGLITFRPGVTVNASKLLGGDVDLSFQQTKVNGKPTQIVNIDTDSIELSELLTFLSTKLPISGKVNLAANAEIESTFAEQPKGQMELQINRFDLTSDTVSTPLGPLNLPPLTLNRVNLKGELRDGRFVIEQMTAGQPSDELTANVKGRVDMRVQPGPFFQPGGYDLEVQLTAKESLKQKAGLFLSLIGSYQKPGPNGTTVYAFRIRGTNFYGPPNMSAL